MYVSPDLASLLFLLSCILFFAIFGVRCCQPCTGCGDSLQIEWVTKTMRKGQLPFRLDVPAFFLWSAWFKIWLCTFYFIELSDIFKIPFICGGGNMVETIFLSSSFCCCCRVYFIYLLSPSSLVLCFCMLLCLHSWVLCQRMNGRSVIFNLLCILHSMLCSMAAIVSQWTWEFESSPFISFGWLEEVLKAQFWDW